MRTPRAVAVAVRNPQGEIVVQKRPYLGWQQRIPFFRWPLMRGVAALFESLVLGIKALVFPANEALAEEEEQEELTPLTLFLTIAASIGLAILLFFILPFWAAHFFRSFSDYLDSELAFNFLDGIIRIIVFLLYVVGISFVKDIRRVFEYHGAEHEVVFAYEASEELSVENAQKYSTHHPRCGTSFLFIVMLISIIAFSLIPKEASIWAKMAARIWMLPLIAGSAYEIIRYAGEHPDNWLIRPLMLPGLWLQRITTRTPSEDQIEVALTALREALSLEQGEDADLSGS